MTIGLWAAFTLACCIVLVIPGPTILTVISYSISHGNRASLPLIAAVALGDSTALALSLAGLGAIIATSAWLFTAIKLLGGAYLIYLGLKLLLSGTASVANGSAKDYDSRRKLFFNTWLVTALNPKGIIFFVAFLPQFVNPAAPTAPQLWVLAATFVVLATLNAALYALFAQAARQLLMSPRAQRRFNIGGGSLLMVAGSWALSAKHTV